MLLFFKSANFNKLAKNAWEDIISSHENKKVVDPFYYKKYFW